MPKLNKKKILDEYEKFIYDKIDRFLFIVSKNDAVRSATINEGKIHIEFTEEVDIEGQDVFNVFIKGGAIKKTESKDNIKEQYFEIPAIGELL